jgi:hypothetical protein
VTSKQQSADYAIPHGVLSRRVDDEMVLLNMSTEQYYGLDAVGADIVERITTQPLHAALAALARDYEVAPEVLRADAERLIGELGEAGLLQPAPQSP